MPEKHDFFEKLISLADRETTQIKVWQKWTQEDEFSAIACL
jgi:hypothetical protein